MDLGVGKLFVITQKRKSFLKKKLVQDSNPKKFDAHLDVGQ